MVQEDEMASPMTPIQPSTMSQTEINQRFYRHFQAQCIELQEQIEQLDNYSFVGGEKQDAMDHVVSGVKSLANEVMDATGFVTSYDQNVYKKVCWFHTASRLYKSQQCVVLIF